ncbi:MAG TPA: hypothetical protein VFN74_23530, partial [Chloroflexota bacterium]|nr:hypothetical protein [Chloroflexota bacterium]
HVPAGMCLFLGAALLRAGRLGFGGALLATAAAFEYPAAAPAALLVAIELVHSRAAGREAARQVGAIAAGAAPAGLVLAAYHTLAFGAPWRTGYAFVDSSGPFAAAHASGLLGVSLPHPGIALELFAGAQRGLLVVAPWLALALVGVASEWRRDRAAVAQAMAVFFALLAINAGYAVWDGGASWGPRHLVAALPFLAPLALPLAARRPALTRSLVAVSVVITTLAVGTGTLPPPGATAFGGFLLPALRYGAAGNTLTSALGLAGWHSLVGLAAVALVSWWWAIGLRRGYGVALAVGLTLLAAARLDDGYREYAEGYYLYLASRVADGASLYRDVESTQTPGVSLVAAALWSVLPGVFAPRLLALVCWLAAALLSGCLAERLAGRSASALGTMIAVLLPLGASAPQVLDANAVLAPLVVTFALCLVHGPRGGGWQVRAAAVATLGTVCKLTFLPLAVAALASARQRAWKPLALTALMLAVVSLAAYMWAGSAALDAVTGELESPLLPAGALLATLQFVRLEGLALPLAGFALWHLRRNESMQPAHALALTAALMPLLALHQGTFVSVARPAEPLVAAYAGAGIVRLSETVRRGRLLVRASLLALATALPVSLLLTARDTRPTTAPAEWTDRYARSGEALLTPPFFAARAGRAMLFDYADWTVLGMRAAAGMEPERTFAGEIVEQLATGALPFVIADFRLAYIPAAWQALEARYVRTATDGAGALEVSLWLPRRDAAR